MIESHEQQIPIRRWEIPYLLGADTAIFPLCWGYACCQWYGFSAIDFSAFTATTAVVWCFALSVRLWKHRSSRCIPAKYAILLPIAAAITCWYLLQYPGRSFLKQLQIPLWIGGTGLVLYLMNRTFGRWALLLALVISCYLPACYLDFSGQFLFITRSALLLPWMLTICYPRWSNTPGSHILNPKQTTFCLSALGICSCLTGVNSSADIVRGLSFATGIGTLLGILSAIGAAYLSREMFQALRWLSLALPPLVVYLFI